MKRCTQLLLAAALALLPVSLLGAGTASAASAKPTCVVSLSPTATETLFAIGAGPQVQAVDDDSDYPTHGLPSKKINALSPSVEAVAGICSTKGGHSTKPDLVVISYDANSIAEHLSALGIKVVEQDAPSTVSGALAQIRQLGQLTGHKAKADTLATTIKKTIAKDIASVPSHKGKKVTVYYELDPTLYSLTSSTFVGSLLKSLGAVNIADPESSAADGGYPQLSKEYLISASPKLVFLADTICCQVSAKNFGARTGFSTISAVRYGHVVPLNDDVASRWGPRLGVLMNQLTAGVKATLRDSRVWK